MGRRITIVGVVSLLLIPPWSAMGIQVFSWQDLCRKAEHVVMGSLHATTEHDFVINGPPTNFFFHFKTGWIAVDGILKGGSELDSIPVFWCSHWTEGSQDGPIVRIIEEYEGNESGIWVLLSADSTRRYRMVRRPSTDIDEVTKIIHEVSEDD